MIELRFFYPRVPAEGLPDTGPSEKDKSGDRNGDSTTEIDWTVMPKDLRPDHDHVPHGTAEDGEDRPEGETCRN